MRTLTPVLIFFTIASFSLNASTRELARLEGEVTLYINNWTTKTPKVTVHPDEPQSFIGFGYHYQNNPLASAHSFTFGPEHISFFLPENDVHGNQTISFLTLLEFVRRKKIIAEGNLDSLKALQTSITAEKKLDPVGAHSRWLHQNIKRAFDIYFQGQEVIDHNQITFNCEALLYAQKHDGSYRIIFMPPTAPQP